MKNVLAAVLIMCLSLSLSAVDVVLLTQNPSADTLVEWELRNHDPAWLTNDVQQTPVLEITSPNGRPWTRSAFTYQPCAASDGAAPAIPRGDLVLRIRHTPRVAGVHRWVLKDPRGKQIASGSLTASNQTGPYPLGMLKISKHNARLLSFYDGTIFIPIGPNLCWANAPKQLQKFTAWCEALGKEGANHIRLWCASWCGSIEGDNPDQYRLEQAWLLDALLGAAREHGLKVTLVIDNHHDVGLGKFVPYGATYGERIAELLKVPLSSQYQRRLRYLLARYGADDTIAAWELMNEIDLAQPKREEAVKWVAAAAAFFAKNDIDKRLITCSWSGDDWEQVAKIPQIDLGHIHSYVVEWTDKLGIRKKQTRDGIDMLLSSAERGNRLGKPFLFAEVGYQGTNEDNKGNAADKDGLLLRQQLWGGFLLGGCGGGMNWWWDTYIEQRKLWRLYGGMAKVVAKLNWRDQQLLPVTPNNGSALRVIGWQSPTQALLWPQIRDDTWYTHVVDRKGRAKLNADMTIRLRGMKPKSRLIAHYMDMLSGKERLQREIVVDVNGNVLLPVVAPNVDVVVWIEPGA